MFATMLCACRQRQRVPWPPCGRTWERGQRFPAMLRRWNLRRKRPTPIQRIAPRHAVFAQRLEAWNSPDSGVQQQFRNKLAETGEPDLATAAAKVFAMYLETMQQELIEDAPATATAASALPTASVKAPPARHAGAAAMGCADGDTQLPARSPVKLAAQAQTSATQAAKHAVAINQRVGKRQQTLAMTRDEFIKVQADELAARDAGETDDLSDNGSST